MTAQTQQTMRCYMGTGQVEHHQFGLMGTEPDRRWLPTRSYDPLRRALVVTTLEGIVVVDKGNPGTVGQLYEHHPRYGPDSWGLEPEVHYTPEGVEIEFGVLAQELNRPVCDPDQSDYQMMRCCMRDYTREDHLFEWHTHAGWRPYHEANLLERCLTVSTLAGQVVIDNTDRSYEADAFRLASTIGANPITLVSHTIDYTQAESIPKGSAQDFTTRAMNTVHDSIMVDYAQAELRVLAGYGTDIGFKLTEYQRVQLEALQGLWNDWVHPYAHDLVFDEVNLCLTSPAKPPCTFDEVLRRNEHYHPDRLWFQGDSQVGIDLTDTVEKAVEQDELYKLAEAMDGPVLVVHGGQWHIV